MFDDLLFTILNNCIIFLFKPNKCTSNSSLNCFCFQRYLACRRVQLRIHGSSFCIFTIHFQFFLEICGFELHIGVLYNYGSLNHCTDIKHNKFVNLILSCLSLLNAHINAMMHLKLDFVSEKRTNRLNLFARS